MSDPQGFPGRSSHDELGGTQENRFPVTEPRKQLDLRAFSAMRWQVAGMNKLAPLVSLTVDDTGQKIAGGEAWNSLDDPTRRVTITKTGTGVYEIETQASAYNDWRGDDGPTIPVVFFGAIVSASSAVSVRPPTWVLNSSTKITVYTWDAAGVAADMTFTIDIK